MVIFNQINMSKKIFKLDCCTSCELEKEQGYGEDIDGCCCKHKSYLTNSENKILEVLRKYHERQIPVTTERIANYLRRDVDDWFSDSWINSRKNSLVKKDILIKKGAFFYLNNYF